MDRAGSFVTPDVWRQSTCLDRSIRTAAGASCSILQAAALAARAPPSGVRAASSIPLFLGSPDTATEPSHGARLCPVLPRGVLTGEQLGDRTATDAPREPRRGKAARLLGRTHCGGRAVVPAVRLQRI